uniref:TetR family transcriptional regulator n=1 Tax=Thermosporothrix sp. COM3 TaxID=2490863 RepID=A0A455SFK3_9CHLR|nr:TetR family transcriptional regulator [Thermosporothrix sp. COM3]
MENEHPVQRRGRPRSVQTHQAILDATIDLLEEQGFEAFSIEAVAARAKVGKPAIYRRWPSREALIVDALASLAADLPFVDTGNLREDMLSLIQAFLWLFSSSKLGALIVQLGTTIVGNPELFARYQQHVIAPHLQELAQRLERAVERGEVRPDIDIATCIHLIIGPLVYHVFISGDLFPTATPFPESLVDTILAGITARV